MPTITPCPSCGKKNRVPLAARGRPRCAVCGTDLPWLVEAGEAEFADAVEQATVPVVVDVWAPWCGPCRTMGPIIDQAAHDLAGRVKVVKVNADEAPQVVSRHGITGIPTLLLYSGGVEKARLVGAQPPPVLRRWVESQIEAPA